MYVISEAVLFQFFSIPYPARAGPQDQEVLMPEWIEEDEKHRREHL